MRTRFLNIDYFSLDPTLSHETLAFLHLSIPRLPSPPPFSAVDHHHRLDSSLRVSPHTGSLLPIDSVLSDFLSDVLPHRIDVDFQDLDDFAARADENRISQQEEEDTYYEVEDLRTSVSEADKWLKENNWPAPCDKDESASKIILFETPEPDALLEIPCFPLEIRMQVLSETPGAETHLENLKPELSTHFHCEVLESMSLVQKITSEYLEEQNANSSEKNVSVQNLSHSNQCIFPILEVDEESLEILTCSSMIKFDFSHFDDVRPQSFDENCNSTIESKELLGSKEYDITDSLSDYFLSKQSMILPDMLPEKDFIIMLETEDTGQNSFLQGTLQPESASLMNLFTFQELVFLDNSLIQNFEVLFVTKALNYPERSDNISEEMFPFKNFNELVVSKEIALIDETFKSLPVPIISDYGERTFFNVIIGEIISNLKTYPLSASDGIYLNWDLLEGDKCNCKIYHHYQNMWAKMDLSSMDFEEKAFDYARSALDLVLSSETIDGSEINQSDELQKLLSDCTSLLDDYSVGLVSSKLLDDGSIRQGNQQLLDEIVAEGASHFFRSMSEISNLDYFLDPQKATAIENCKFAVGTTDANVNVQKVTSADLKASCVSTGLQSQGWRTILHTIRLTDNIVSLIGNFERTYLTILQRETDLANSDIGNLRLLKLQKCKLMQCYGNGNNMAFIALCAIKQAAWYLCYYGLHPAYLYVDKLCQSSDELKSRLNFLLSLIKDENRKVDDKITSAHPSLIAFEEILKSNNKHDGLKVLIVAEEVFWFSLECLLLSMGLSFNACNVSCANQMHAYNTVEDTDSKMKDLLISDCLIVSYKNVSPLFPFNKFGLIVEYGGSYGSSRISDLSTNSVGLSHLHVLKVELDDHATLCEGVEMPPYTEVLMENMAHLIFDPKETMTSQKLERLLNFCPTEKNYNTRSSKAADKIDCFVPQPIPAVKSEDAHQRMDSFPGTVIIMNTQNVDKEMIVSRRSAYQVILAMEKGGVQVVERDLDLPVDIIISSAICLVWYDNKNLGKKETFATEASSILPLCIENIATDVLTLLRLSFQGCFMVFEGESSFLSRVMDSSDGLYAAAASLGIDLQIFFSHSSRLTNEIIVSCIKYTAKLTRGVYFKMPDSLTLAESFLTNFPSINPLTAHAILSSGTKLSEFLKWSHERRINDLEKYNVPEESLALFSVFCRYGEREDSKSIVTDCCSSGSSGPDSDRCHFYQIDNERKRKRIGTPQKDEPNFDEMLRIESLDQVVNVFGSSNPSKYCTDGMLNDAGQSTNFIDTGNPMSNLFSEKQMFNVTTTRSAFKVSQPLYDSSNRKGPRIIDQLKEPCLSSKDEEFTQNDILKTGIMSKARLHENIASEVAELTENLQLDDNFSLEVNADSMNFPSLMTGTETDHIRKNKLARLSVDQSSHPEANSSHNWKFSRDKQREVDHYLEPDFLKDIFPPTNSQKLHEGIAGEVVHLADDDLLDKNFSPIFDSRDSPSSMAQIENEQRRKNTIASGRPLNRSNQHEESYSNIWKYLKDTRGSVEKFQEPHFGNDVSLLDVNHWEKISEEGFIQEPTRDSQGLPFQDEMSHLGGTPISRALQLSSQIKSSPWRREFINKMKDKYKSHIGNSAPFGYSGNTSKFAKRSPSTIDSFKYRGNRTPGVFPEQKEQKQCVQSSKSANKRKHSASTLHTLTTKGEKARKTHPIAMNESGFQTKLVWSNGTLGITKKLQYRKK